MLKENKKTLKQIDKYIKNNTPNTFSRQCGKSIMVLRTIQINYGLEIYKEFVRNATEHVSFERVLNLVTDVMYRSDIEEFKTEADNQMADC